MLGDFQEVADFFGSEEKLSEAAQPFEEYLFQGKANIQEALAKYIRQRRYSFDELHEIIHKEINAPRRQAY